MRETGSVAGWNLLLKFPRRINARQIKRKFLLRSGNFVKPLCKFLSSPSCCSPLANCVKPAGKISRPPYRRIEVKLTTRLTMLMHLRSFFFFFWSDSENAASRRERRFRSVWRAKVVWKRDCLFFYFSFLFTQN